MSVTVGVTEVGNVGIDIDERYQSYKILKKL